MFSRNNQVCWNVSTLRGIYLRSKLLNKSFLTVPLKIQRSKVPCGERGGEPHCCTATHRPVYIDCAWQFDVSEVMFPHIFSSEKMFLHIFSACILRSLLKEPYSSWYDLCVVSNGKLMHKVSMKVY